MLNNCTLSLFLSLKDGSTALFKAAFKGHNSVIEELLKFSPSLGLLKVEDDEEIVWHIISCETLT